MKQKLTSEDVSCLVPALNKILDGSYLVQVYDGGIDDTKTIIMKFRNKVDGITKIYFLLFIIDFLWWCCCSGVVVVVRGIRLYDPGE